MIFIPQSVGKQKNCPALVILLKGIEMYPFIFQMRPKLFLNHIGT
jgi:hypothetical protein